MRGVAAMDLVDQRSGRRSRCVIDAGSQPTRGVDGRGGADLRARSTHADRRTCDKPQGFRTGVVTGVVIDADSTRPQAGRGSSVDLDRPDFSRSLFQVSRGALVVRTTCVATGDGVPRSGADEWHVSHRKSVTGSSAGSGTRAE